MLALSLALGLPAVARSAAGDTIADRELGQADFVHATSPSFIRQRSLDLEGDPRSNGVAIDLSQSPSPIYVADTNTNRVLGWHDVSSFANGADADIVIGAPDFFTGSGGCQGTGTGFCTPFTVAVDGAGALYVSGSRVDKFAATFAQAPPIVGTSFIPSGTFDPWGVAFDSHGNAYVAMRNQHEVLEYDSGQTTAHLVFGQASASGGPCNQNGSPSATTLCAPYAVAVDGNDNLYVVDTGNHRVLAFHTPLDAASGETGAGDTTADIVIGQSGFTTGGAGTSATTLMTPRGLGVDVHGNLYVADTFNDRVTEYDAPLSTGEAATLVIGQANATSNGCNRGGPVGVGTLCQPTGVAVDASDAVWVYDSDNDRVVGFPESNPPRTATATRVLGQHDLTHATRNFVDATTVNPGAVAIDRHTTPNHLYVVDATNNRVLGYDDAATFTNGGAASLVLGQPDFFSNGCDAGTANCAGGVTVSATTVALNFNNFQGIAVDSQGNVWVSDPGNRRALGYAAPFSSGMVQNEPATKVLGEPDLMTAAGGIGCTPTPTATCQCRGLAVDASDNLYLIDGENERVLEFDTPWTFPGTPPQAATLVIGQDATGTNFSGHGCNQFFNASPGETADSVCNPTNLALDAHGNLYVADAGNNRVLEYDAPLPSGGGTPGTPGHAGDVTADLVFGQGGAFHTAVCGLDATSLCGPTGVSVDGSGAVFISEFMNNRVLAFAEFANPPTNVTAALEFGQGTTGTDFTHGTANAGGLSANSLDLATGAPGVATDAAGDLYVADTGNARLIAYGGPFSALLPTTTTTSTTSTSVASSSTSLPTTTTTHPPITTTTHPPITTTTQPPTTTTTLPPQDCAGTPQGATFASILCRLDALAARVQGASGLGSFQSKLAKSLDTARSRTEDAQSLCDAGAKNAKKTKKRLQEAGKALSQYVHRLAGLPARNKLDGTVRSDFLKAGQAIEPDLSSLRAHVQCPPA
jgi:hypothetical protein